MRDPDFTLSAGPTSVSPRVAAALGKPVVYHYDPVFLETFRRTERKLADVFRTGGDVLIMQGEAIAALEGAARSLVRPGTVALNLVSGPFGKGMGAWLAELGADVVELAVPYNEAVDPGDVERALAARPEIDLVAVVQSETPSATVNPVAELGPLARAHGAVTLVDSVSALGGMPVEPDAWQLDLVVAGPQKCLSGPPGLGLVAVSDDAWRRIEANPLAPRASFLSLLDWRERWHGEGRFPFTPSVSDVHGLEAALDQALEEGLEAAFARHDLAAAACRAGVRALGLEVWAARDEIAANCTTAVTLPEGIDERDVLRVARERYGVMLSGSYGAGRLVRIGHMGDGARGLLPVVGVMALGRSLADLGVSVRVGDGVEAALEVVGAAVPA
jgi:pyridoxamine--pyruvate transaminase